MFFKKQAVEVGGVIDVIGGVKKRGLVALFALTFPVLTLANELLMSKAGCVSCHRVDQKLNGPAFKAVAARYKNDPNAPEYLFEKIREGGDGVWGDLPMVPNGPDKISDDDLKSLIAWILSQ